MGQRMQRALSPQGLVLGGMALVAAAVLGLSATGTLQFNLVPPPPGREPASIGSPLYPAPPGPVLPPTTQPAQPSPGQPSPGRTVRLAATSAPPGTPGPEPGGAGTGTGGEPGGGQSARPSPPAPSTQPSTPVPVRSSAPAPASPLPPSPLPAPKPSTGLCVSVLGVRACIHL